MTNSEKFVTGAGAPDADLAAADFRRILGEALSNIAPETRVLAIISDKTRDDNTPALFPVAAQILAEKGISKLDALVAQGTHSPMPLADKLSKIGANNLSEIPNLENIFDHDWSDPEKLTVIGELSAEKVREVTKNLFSQPIKLSINKLLAA